MCGITGFVKPRLDTSREALVEQILKMMSPLTHRGPDQEGYWVDEKAGLAFGHLRLSILELSDYGRQPMISPSKRYVMVFNGEIYNFPELRYELQQKGISFLGSSDSEVLLAAIDTWGIKVAVSKCEGMFAIALWDSVEETLFLIRDRVGIKPLYYGWLNENCFGFSSEITAFEALNEFDRRINNNSVHEQIIYSYISAPHSIYEGIYKLMPASILSLKLKKDSHFEVSSYWSFVKTAKSSVQNLYIKSPKEAISDLEAILSESVKKHMLADVPLGAFLSGGIDSSLIVSLMQAHSTRPIKTFTIGFNETGYDEAKQAKKIASILKTEHTELYVSMKDVRDVITKLPAMYDEPFSDSSQIATFLVSQCARGSVKVGLSGDGGDELFAGYNRYLWTDKIWKIIRWQGILGRNLLSQTIEATPKAFLNTLYEKTAGLLGKNKFSLIGDKLYKLAQVIKVEDRSHLYQNLLKQIVSDQQIVYGIGLGRNKTLPEWPNFVEAMMLQDSTNYLVDDILTKLDRASMAVGLEARVPFLSQEVIQFAWQLPMEIKVKEGRGKWILRQILYKYLPKDLVDQPKRGFAVPIGVWLKTELRDWAENLFQEMAVQHADCLNMPFINQCWKEHLSGKRNWQYFLWNVLMFQVWSSGRRNGKMSVIGKT